MNQDKDDITCHPSVWESRISPELKDAQDKLIAAGYQVSRHVKNSVVFGLEVFGETFYHLEKVRSIVGPERKLVLNSNYQRILIK